MATSKTPHTPIIDDDFLAGIKSADNVQDKTPATEPVKPVQRNEPAPTGNDKKVLCNIKVNESTLKNWKQFTLDHDTTLTETIKRAMNYYIKNVDNGTIEL